MKAVYYNKISGRSVKKEATCSGMFPSCHHRIDGQPSHTEKPLFVILILTSTFTLVENKSFGSPTTYIHNGVTCMKCPTGTRVSNHCTQDFTHSSCVRCGPGTYQALAMTELETCGVCDDGCPDVNAVVIDNCTSEHNLRCECDDGYYDKHHALGVIACVKFSKCPSGQIIEDEGGPLRNVVCGWCPRGQFYSDTSDHCSDCTLCSSLNLITMSSCTKHKDTVCGVYPTTVIESTPATSRNGHSNSLIIFIISTLLGALLLTGVCCGALYLHKRKKKRNRKNQRRTKRSSDQKEMKSFIEDNPVQILSSPPDKKKWTDKIFLHIHCRISNWKTFLRHLPVPAGNTFDADLEIENNTDGKTEEKIYQILLRWYRQCYDAVSMEAIQLALENSGNKGIVNGVIGLYNESVRSHGISEDISMNVEDSHGGEVCVQCNRHGIGATSESQHLSEDCHHTGLKTVADTDRTFVKEPLLFKRDDHTNVKRV